MGYYYDFKGPDRGQTALVAAEMSNNLNRQLDTDIIKATDDKIILFGSAADPKLFIELSQTKTYWKLYFKAVVHIGKTTKEFSEWEYPEYNSFEKEVISFAKLFFNKKVKVVVTKKAFKGIITDFLCFDGNNYVSVFCENYTSLLVAIMVWKNTEKIDEYDFSV